VNLSLFVYRTQDHPFSTLSKFCQLTNRRVSDFSLTYRNVVPTLSQDDTILLISYGRGVSEAVAVA
jgi:hypothetical protein